MLPGPPPQGPLAWVNFEPGTQNSLALCHGSRDGGVGWASRGLSLPSAFHHPSIPPISFPSSFHLSLPSCFHSNSPPFTPPSSSTTPSFSMAPFLTPPSFHLSLPAPPSSSFPLFLHASFPFSSPPCSPLSSPPPSPLSSPPCVPPWSYFLCFWFCSLSCSLPCSPSPKVPWLPRPQVQLCGFSPSPCRVRPSLLLSLCLFVPVFVPVTSISGAGLERGWGGRTGRGSRSVSLQQPEGHLEFHPAGSEARRVEEEAETMRWQVGKRGVRSGGLFWPESLSDAASCGPGSRTGLSQEEARTIARGQSRPASSASSVAGFPVGRLGPQHCALRKGYSTP